MNMEPKHTLFALGIDTGGTYTDAVIFHQDLGVVGKAKALTTRHDLAIGISAAVDNALDASSIDAASIGMVSISTTLATNALVEGQGDPVGLILAGFKPDDLHRAGLGTALAGDPVLLVPGGHDVHGNQQTLDLGELDPFLERHRHQIAGFAVAGMFAVRNPDHELKIRERLLSSTGLPVTCSHELSAKLGGPKRALTTLLNARLIGINSRLIQATQQFLTERRIRAPLMVVRGDGSLISADFATSRPIETILSGPAASLVGARFLTGLDAALVSDIGGTTTDIAILNDGRPRINPAGAEVGGYKTMVEAVAMYTFGLGGDSEVSIDEANRETRLKIGPRRQVPIALLAVDHPDLIKQTLTAQLKSERISEKAGLFARRVGGLEHLEAALSKSEKKLIAEIGAVPVSLEDLIRRSAEMPILHRLVSKGLVQIAGFTPSDASHILGESDQWDGETAELAGRLMARRKDRFGDRLAADALEISRRVKQQLVMQSAKLLLQACLSDDNLIAPQHRDPLIDLAIARTGKTARLSMQIDRPLVGLGASAPVYYPAIANLLNVGGSQPEHCDVANAVGAVAGHIRHAATLLVTSMDGGGTYDVRIGAKSHTLADEQEALERATSHLQHTVTELALAEGAVDPQIEISQTIDAPEIEGQRHFIQAEITVIASGRPRLAIAT